MRIDQSKCTLCGYEGEHDLPGWSVFEWSAHGGYEHQGKNGTSGNRHRERVWFSPHCLNGGMKQIALL